MICLNNFKLNSDFQFQISEEDLKKLTLPVYMPLTPPNVFRQLYDLIKRHTGMKPYPFISQVNHRTRDMLQVP